MAGTAFLLTLSLAFLFSNVTAIEDGLNPGYSRSFGYDDLDRLTWDSGVSAAAPTYSYDGNGNRLTRTATLGGLLSQALTYTPASNRLATFQEGAASPTTAQYDGMGNLAQYRPGVLIGYDAGGRLASVWDAGIATGAQTLYNGLGELARSRLWTPAPCDDEQLLLAMEYFSFAPDGRALELRSEKLWSTHTDYVWLDGQPVAQFMDSYDPSGVYQGTAVTYLHTDQLDTPRLGTDAQRAVTWRWQSEAFGSAVPTGPAIVRLRLAGQLDLGIGGINYSVCIPARAGQAFRSMSGRKSDLAAVKSEKKLPKAPFSR